MMRQTMTTGVTEETPAQIIRARIIRQFDRKKRDKKGNIIKSWEADSSRRKKTKKILRLDT